MKEAVINENITTDAAIAEKRCYTIKEIQSMLDKQANSIGSVAEKRVQVVYDWE